VCCTFSSAHLFSSQSKSKYSEARHRAIRALHCAKNKHPFESQDDELYRLEVDLLRPRAVTPSSVIVQRDAGTLYNEYTKVVRYYFE
ncbi:hypothetical protein B0H14DRAFT_2170423, partial [Mycena olivaceomarginata]